MLLRLGWSFGGYGVVQSLRLVSNVALSRLLAPELFGIMLIVNTVRTGIELASDVGIGQNIISNPRAEETRFIDTAWTLQATRGVVLGLICLAIAWPVGAFYRNPVLPGVFMVSSLFFVFTGFESTARFVAQKQLRLKELTLFEVGYTIVTVVSHIGFALVTPTIWALVFGGVTSSAAVMIGSYWLMPGIRHRLTLDRTALREILSFGRWVLIASVVYFLAMNFDRLYMARTVSLAVLGTYGIARSLSDILNLLVARAGNFIIFPMVAASFDTISELRARLARHRPFLLLAAAAAVAGFASVADLIVGLLYDGRYQAAASMLPALAMGVWFSIVSTVNESVLLGIGKPIYSASANVVKFVWLLVCLPVAVHFHGIAGAVVVIATAELVRYGPLWLAQRREGLSFALQDMAMTLVMLGLTVLFRETLSLVGLTGNVVTLLPWR
jgi:O-antigen/teichoic acid export membrane protein